MTAQQLRDDRADLGLSQSELAEYLGVPANTVARWERGEVGISQPTILALAMAEVRRRVGAGGKREAPRPGRPRKIT